MNEKKIFAQIHTLWSDLHYPEFYWVVMALLMIKFCGRTSQPQASAHAPQANLAFLQPQTEATGGDLARRGVETLRVAAKNYAMQTPAADDNTVQAHAHNRSVPFQVL